MASSTVAFLVLCTISVVSMHYYPENGYQITVPKYVLKIIVANALAYVSYRLFFYKSPTPKSKFIYFSSNEKMRAQVAREYKAEKLELTSEYPCPKVVHPNDVLVRVCAASINPIDHRLIAGHARPIFDKMRQQKKLPYGGAELPLVLGRDCSGVVESVGCSVDKFRTGDEKSDGSRVARNYIKFLATLLPSDFCKITGIGAEDLPGTFAEKVLAKDYMIAKKPRLLDHTEATSIPYVCTTTWSALVGGCGLGPSNTKGKRVLILGGTGGLGSFAIQLIKAWGGHVTTTCSTNGIGLVEHLGADEVIDYTKGNLEDALAQLPKFDVIYVTINPTVIGICQSALKKGGQLVTVVVPFIGNFNKHGKMLGTVVNAALKLRWMVQDFYYNRKTICSFNRPDGGALEEISQLVDDGKIKPVIQRTFDFEALNEAMEFVKQGHARGKTVIVMPQSFEK